MILTIRRTKQLTSSNRRNFTPARPRPPVGARSLYPVLRPWRARDGAPCAGRQLLLLAWLATLLLCGCGTPNSAARAGRTFRVATYNIHHGEGLDRKVDLVRIVELLQRERADIVALQEVDKGTERTARRDFPAELARLSGMTCIFSNNYSFQGGQYGNAVLTRFPVHATTNIHYRMPRPGEQRGLLQVVLDVNGRELVFLNTHLDFRPEDSERLSSVDEMLFLANRYKSKPVIICGDFNDVPGSRTHRKLAETFVDSWTVAGQGEGFTIPADQPRKRIDYIWISRDSNLEPLRAWVQVSNASDHLPLLAEFRFTPIDARPANRSSGYR
jgi:endonuclease/exonuclease/phosphatase family metal-dependent hydrolase